jgi:three-Cys-motif partner protein
MVANNNLDDLKDDGLITPIIKQHSIEKLRFIAYYAALFATGMKNRWDCLVYIDLFAGSGRGKVKRTNKIVAGSPIRAIELRDRFDKYIFCDINPKYISALKNRVSSIIPTIDADYIVGNINANVDTLLDTMPSHRTGYTTLSFCLVDPYNMGNIHFDTIEQLSTRYMDFLVLIPSYMDINRRPELYQEENNYDLDYYLGTDAWRSDWRISIARTPNLHFGVFVAQYFEKRMTGIGFRQIENNQYLIRGRTGINLYHLSFFSKSETGERFWKKALRGVPPQLSLL